MEKLFTKILYGGDYNPEQWPREIWEEDMRLFGKAHINSATINVFSWAKIQPNEITYDFRELDDIVEMLSQRNYDIIMATSTAAMPAWMVKRYPEVLRSDYYANHSKFGGRANACPNSQVYKKYSSLLAEKLAEHYKNNKHIFCWHINNEYGGICYCDNCEKEFRIWLKNKYKSLDALNKAWNTAFWSHTVYDWDEIVVPNALGDGGWGKPNFAGIYLDYQRFSSESFLNNFKAERDAIRKHIPDAFITTNFMGAYKPINYYEWAKEMDIVSWDNYPAYNTPWSYVAMMHDLMRGLKSKPFLLMEQTPSQQNWQQYCSLKKPGQMSAQSYQTIAHGAESILFFQLRRSVGGCEKFHGAVISHSGSDKTRVFKEVEKLGEELERLGDKTIGSVNRSDVGIIFDWENYWAVEAAVGPTSDMNYVDQLHDYYKHLYKRNISVDIIPCDADFSKYKVIYAPLLYMIKSGMKENLENYVKSGGILVTGYMSGIVNESDNVYTGGYPGPLRSMAGVWVEEIDALAPEQSNSLNFGNGVEFKCGFLCDIIHTEGAEVLAEYENDFYAGTPAVTKNTFGDGYVYYVGTKLSDDGLEYLTDKILESAKVKPVIDFKTDLEVTMREKNGKKYYFVINFTGKEQPLPNCFNGCVNLLSDECLAHDRTVKPFESFVIEQ